MKKEMIKLTCLSGCGKTFKRPENGFKKYYSKECIMRAKTNNFLKYKPELSEKYATYDIFLCCQYIQATEKALLMEGIYEKDDVLYTFNMWFPKSLIRNVGHNFYTIKPDFIKSKLNIINYNILKNPCEETI